VLDSTVWHRVLIVAIWHPWTVAGCVEQEIARVVGNGLTLIVVGGGSELA